MIMKRFLTAAKHMCRKEGYCKSKKKECFRFGNPYVHNRVVSHYRRGNTDLQIILDPHACIENMVKYCTKSEKGSSDLNGLFKYVILHVNKHDNPTKQLKKLMLKTVSGKRDLGKCEVSRLLLSEPLYSSYFQYVNICLDLKDFNNCYVAVIGIVFVQIKVKIMLF